MGMWGSNFTIVLSCCFEMSALTMQGKEIPSFLALKITVLKAG